MRRSFGGLNGPHLTWSAFAESETAKKRIRTVTNGLNFFFKILLGRPLTPSFKVLCFSFRQGSCVSEDNVW